uniref:Uncharacterized protein n=1 Tax=Anguilla anguilla TaxID=7936 RepID=A0A0E9WBY3_ANGAN
MNQLISSSLLLGTYIHHDKLHTDSKSNAEICTVNPCRLLNIKFKFSWQYRSRYARGAGLTSQSHFLQPKSDVQSLQSQGTNYSHCIPHKTKSQRKELALFPK